MGSENNNFCSLVSYYGLCLPQFLGTKTTEANKSLVRLLISRKTRLQYKNHAYVMGRWVRKCPQACVRNVWMIPNCEIFTNFRSICRPKNRSEKWQNNCRRHALFTTVVRSNCHKKLELHLEIRPQKSSRNMAKFFFQLDPDFHQLFFYKFSNFWNFWDKIFKNVVYEKSNAFQLLS